MVLVVLITGCTLFLCLGVGFLTWAGSEMQEEGLDIGNIIMFSAGIGIFVFGCFCTYKASVYYRENENPKTETEIVTSTSPQIDTVITIRNSVSDTTYIYKFNIIEKT